MLGESEKDAEVLNAAFPAIQDLAGKLGQCRLKIFSEPHEILAAKIVKAEDLLRQISAEITDSKKRLLSIKHGLADEMRFSEKQHRLADFEKEEKE